MKAIYTILALSFFPITMAKTQFNTTSSPEVIEVIGAYPVGSSATLSMVPTIVKPNQKTFSQFGGLTQDHSFSLDTQKKEFNIQSRVLCGNSPEQNTLSCYDLNRNGMFMANYPIPGSLSTTPVYFNKSWLIGTTKGLLLKVDANLKNRMLPYLGDSMISLWGNFSRSYISSLKPKTLYADNKSNTSSSDKQATPNLPKNVQWIYSSSTELVGTPIIFQDTVYALSANHYLHAINWNNGKLIWSVRLAPDTKLRLSSYALTATPYEVIVGTDLGALLALNPKTGSIMWSHQITDSSFKNNEKSYSDYFKAIVAKPLVINRNVITSNSDSMTQNISLESKTAVWSYPAGSVAQPKLTDDHVIIGTSLGELVSLNFLTGAKKWDSQLTADRSPIISLFITKSGAILASNSRGKIFLIDSKNGKILSENFPLGEVNGEFFAGYNNAEACLSFSQNGFRCFYAKL